MIGKHPTALILGVWSKKQSAVTLKWRLAFPFTVKCSKMELTGVFPVNSRDCFFYVALRLRPLREAKEEKIKVAHTGSCVFVVLTWGLRSIGIHKEM